jgi:hypothetical protein
MKWECESIVIGLEWKNISAELKSERICGLEKDHLGEEPWESGADSDNCKCKPRRPQRGCPG